MDTLDFRDPHRTAFNLTSERCVFCHACASHSLLPPDATAFLDSTLCCQCLLVFFDAVSVLAESLAERNLLLPTPDQGRAFRTVKIVLEPDEPDESSV